jgi:hypothetical protein
VKKYDWRFYIATRMMMIQSVLIFPTRLTSKIIATHKEFFLKKVSNAKNVKVDRDQMKKTKKESVQCCR